MNLKVKTKIIDKSIEMPTLKYAKDGDAGIDLIATSKWYDDDGNVCFGTNRAFEIPEGYVGLLFPRSSNSKKDLLLSNSIGILDSGYRGEVMMKYKTSESIWWFDEEKENCVFYTIEDEHYKNSIRLEFYNIGDRIGQLIIMPYPKVEFEEVDDLSETERGEGGYGSTCN